MTSSSPSELQNELKEYHTILIKRKNKKTKEELRISYDTTPLKKLTANEEEKANLLKLVKNILLSCNFSYLIYYTNKIFGFLKSLLFYNFLHFIGLRYIFAILSKKKGPEKNEPQIEVAFWKKCILFNLPELLIIFYYYKKKYEKINYSVKSLFSYLNERISYLFNKDTKNNYLCKVDQKTYDIKLIPKNEDFEKNESLYINNEEYLSKETFFDGVIAYANGEFGDFDFNNLEEKEEKLFQDIFQLINDIEKQIKGNHSLLKTISTVFRNMSFNHAIKFNLGKYFLLKIGGFLIEEFYLNRYTSKREREELIEEKTKEFNHKNMENGYFLTLNENVILLFKIKENYKNYDESYSILYDDSQKLLDHYFK